MGVWLKPKREIPNRVISNSKFGLGKPAIEFTAKPH